ncbi:MAG TPA: GNAT family N-acetyltransferase [Thermoanaerobaculia bacterium]|nr:GNAT family N-acetyltransferase [Thermoanaerobaculia bacterium]
MITIRVATIEDVPAIVALLADDSIGATRERLADPLPGEYAAAFRAIDADPNNELLVAESSGTIVGTLQMTYTPGLSRTGMWRATLEAVRVASASRGAGIGAMLVQEAVERARRRGCGLVQLTTDRRRTDTKRFYERLGFVDTHLGMKLTLERD